MEAENAALTNKNKELTDKSKESLLKKLEIAQLERDYAAAMELIKKVPQDVLDKFAYGPNERVGKLEHKENRNRNGGRDI